MGRRDHPILYNYYNYYSKTIFRHPDAKLPTGHGNIEDRGFDGQKIKFAPTYPIPEPKEADSEVPSIKLDDDSWGDSEYDFGDFPIESPDKTPQNKNGGADGMNSVTKPENRED